MLVQKGQSLFLGPGKASKHGGEREIESWAAGSCDEAVVMLRGGLPTHVSGMSQAKLVLGSERSVSLAVLTMTMAMAGAGGQQTRDPCVSGTVM